MRKNILIFLTLVLAVLLTFVVSNAWAVSVTVTLKDSHNNGLSGGTVRWPTEVGTTCPAAQQEMAR